MNPIKEIAVFIMNAFVHTWPYLLVTIPLAVVVKLSGASRYIKKAFNYSPLVAVLLATVVGAASPFCSCSVVPVIASLLVSGVPLAPVMSFWLASPSMDPEIFLLSASTIGWDLAVWRLAGAFAMSLGAGLVTHFLQAKGWFGKELLKLSGPVLGRTRVESIFVSMGKWIRRRFRARLGPAPRSLCFEAAAMSSSGRIRGVSCKDSACVGSIKNPTGSNSSDIDCGAGPIAYQQTEVTCGTCKAPESTGFWRRLAEESFEATVMVAKFMLLAFFIEALMVLYVPTEMITELLGSQSWFAIPLAALIGIPAYTSNLSALGFVGGLLEQGMSGAAALTFLIAGATTTLPAMAAVYGLASRRVFFLYILFTSAGALTTGFLYAIAIH